ncbi:MAG TPA: hypothetical protein VK892_05940 [Pyrinomonadaceae bacterium]|nr:hypothetical protein [Pyrinomonadaceae bacterium]
MLQKYKQNGLDDSFVSAINAINFEEKITTDTKHWEKTNLELPAAASAGDAREIVRFLSRENASFRINELQAAEPRRVFEPQKLAAYEAWGIIIRDENSIRLSDLGLELAKRNAFEKQIYRQILSNLPQYSRAIEWMSNQNLRIITFHDLANFWENSFPELLLGEKDSREIETVALSFFSICHAAELGIMTIGKRGQPTRLNIDVQELRSFLKKDYLPESFVLPAEFENDSSSKFQQQNLRIYISPGQRREVDNLVELAELADFEALVASDVCLENSLFSPARVAQMQKCDFGLFILDKTHCRKQENGSLELRNEKIIEINTALALFNEKIVLFWDEDESLPQIIQNTKLNILMKTDSEWESGIQIVKALKEFRDKLI